MNDLEELRALEKRALTAEARVARLEAERNAYRDMLAQQVATDRVSKDLNRGKQRDDVIWHQHRMDARQAIQNELPAAYETIDRAVRDVLATPGDA